MAVIATSLTSGEGGTGITSANTASISPTPNRLVLVAVGSKRDTTTPDTPTVSGAGMTWTQVATIAKTDAQRMRTTLFRGLSNSPSPGALTISYGSQVQERLTWVVTEFANVVPTGTNGADAIVQAVTAQTSGSGTTETSSLSITLAALAKASNATYGTVNILNGAITPGSGYTEIAEADSAETNHQSQYKIIGSTTVDWSWTSAYGVGIAVELNEAAGGGGALLALM